MKLKNTVSETDFWEGLRSPILLEAFKQISIKKYINIIQTRTIKLKFVALKILSHIFLFNMIFEVKPSIRALVQCNHCLRFGHTQK